MATEVVRRLFTVEEYHRMVYAGIFREDDRLEIIDGEIIQMSPIGRWHWISVARANALLVKKLDERAVVSIQGPVRLDDWSEPQPDVAVFKPRKDFYAGKPGGPEPGDVLLVVEMADSSLAYDQSKKRSRYARSGLPEYWIVDLNHETLVVYRNPRGDGYETVLTLQRGESMAPLAFPDVEITVDELLGEPPVE
jgi:Uma2 family endonuclease